MNLEQMVQDALKRVQTWINRSVGQTLRQMREHS